MIWIFGDSFSTSFNHPSTFNDWGKDYVSFKGYVPKSFGDILSDEFSVDVKHMAQSGIGNDSIYELICENAPLINKDDIIIIGWSEVTRFRLSGRDNEWCHLISNFQNNFSELPNISENTLEEIFVNRSLKLYVDEYMKRRNFLNWLFRDNVLIHWTPFVNQFKYMLGYGGISTIIDETKDVVKNLHYSETGHKQLSSNFIELIGNDNLREMYNNISGVKLL
jgi:hypothetical protein